MAITQESKQIQVLRFIHEAQSENGYPPTVREIGEAVGLSSSSTIHGHIERLVKKGYLLKDASKPRARAIEVTDIGLEMLGISTNTRKNSGTWNGYSGYTNFGSRRRSN